MTGKCFSCSEAANPSDFLEDGTSAVQLSDLRVLCRHALGMRECGRNTSCDPPR